MSLGTQKAESEAVANCQSFYKSEVRDSQGKNKGGGN